MLWEITDKGDQAARKLVDGITTHSHPHYSRQTPGSRLFTRNGQNLVFITKDELAVWVTFRPTPGKATRPDKLDCWECALFRNESKYRSSELIIEAQSLSQALWGPIPQDGLITFIRPDKVKSRNPGYCYKCAGWTVNGKAKDGKPRLVAPFDGELLSYKLWDFHDDRGGKLRRELCQQN